MDDEPIEKFSEIPADRPIDCFECKKPIAVRYTEVAAGVITHTIMCADCPHLERRLQGLPALGEVEAASAPAGLCCGNCGTTLDAVRKGNLLGCIECYSVFEDVIISELIASNRVSKMSATVKKGVPLHIGRAPGEIKEISPSLKLLALNEALNETLRSEDYEQAAWLRDQIKSLTDQQDGKK